MIELSPVNIGRIILKNKHLSTNEIYSILCDEMQIPVEDKENDTYLLINLKVEIKMLINKCTSCDGKLPCNSPFLFWIEHYENYGYHIVHTYCKVKKQLMSAETIKKLKEQSSKFLANVPYSILKKDSIRI